MKEGVFKGTGQCGRLKSKRNECWNKKEKIEALKINTEEVKMEKRRRKRSEWVSEY